MPITSSGYYSNPAIANVAEGVAKLFAPPSAQDAYAAAQARKTNLEASGLAEYYANANNPAITREQRENAAIGLGLYNPQQSFYSVDQGNATTLEGKRIEGQNAINLEKTKPITVNQGATAYTPDGKILRGSQNLAQGETVYLPGQNGQMGISEMFGPNMPGQGPQYAPDPSLVLKGDPKPLSETELAAQEQERLRASGKLSDDDIRAKVMGTTPVKSIVGPDGKTVLQYQTNAIGKTEAPDPTKAADFATGLRKEIVNLPSYKNYTQALPIYQSMEATAGTNTRASDLNLVYGLGKIMDPTSVVREGEMVLAKNTASLPDWLVGAMNQLNGGAALQPETRKAILKEAYIRAKAYEDALGQDLTMYKGIVQRNGVNEADVIPLLQKFQPYPNVPSASTQVETPAPAGVDPTIWAHMTPEERTLWQN